MNIWQTLFFVKNICEAEPLKFSDIDINMPIWIIIQTCVKDKRSSLVLKSSFNYESEIKLYKMAQICLSMPLDLTSDVLNVMELIGSIFVVTNVFLVSLVVKTGDSLTRRVIVSSITSNDWSKRWYLVGQRMVMSEC